MNIQPMNPAFQPGSPEIKTAFVLGAPGRLERKAGRPAAGQTGVNLDRILKHLNQHDPVRFPSFSRLDYTITNSVDLVLVKSECGRTMPYDAEILVPSNLARLREQLQGVETIVALSEKAKLAVRSVGRIPTYWWHHPSTTRLNNLYPHLAETRAWRVQERIRLYSQELIATELSNEATLPARPPV